MAETSRAAASSQNNVVLTADNNHVTSEVQIVGIEA